MQVRVITAVDGDLVSHYTSTDNLLPFMEARGHAFTKLNDNPRQRTELQGHPKFEGMCGPMWDGVGIRYEDVEAYRQLSA